MRVSARSGEAVCGYCRAPLDAGRVACPACGVGLHDACRTELGRCPTLGCREARKPAPLPARRRWASLLVGVVAVVVVPVLVALTQGFDGPRLTHDRQQELERWAAESERRHAEEARAAALQREREHQAEREAARRRSVLDAYLALVDTPVGAALVPLEVPHHDGAGTPGRALADAACLENRLHLEAGELRRLFTAAALRGVAVRASGWGEVRAGDHGRVDVTISRGAREPAARTRLHAEVRVTRVDPDRLELLVRASGQASPRSEARGSFAGDEGPAEPLDWTETWTAQALRDARARLRGATYEAVHADAPEDVLRTADVVADGTRVHAAWLRTGASDLLPALVRLSREVDGVRHEVEVRELAWERAERR